MNELEKKGDALPDWIALHFSSTDIVNAIKRKTDPNWGGKGSGESVKSPTIGKQKYSWHELKKTPRGILAVLAWEYGVRKADFRDATINELVYEDGKNTIKRESKLLSIFAMSEEE